MAALVIDNLAKSYNGKTVLAGVDFSVEAGALVAILGASGSGKTTLLRLICGFESADAGTIAIAGTRVTGPGVHLPPERRKIGYVAQDGALFPHLSVADNIVFGLPRRDRRARRRLTDLLDMVGLATSFADRAPHQLSGGEQQRVALARALAPGPSLVLLDEPFSALDAALRAETRRVVADALAAAGATALLVTHDQPEALSMGDPVAVLSAGRLAQIASPRALYHAPANANLARFIGEAVLIPGVAGGGRVTCSLGNLSLGSGQGDGDVDVLIRPEQVRLVPFLYGSGVRARIEAISFYGPDAVVSLTCWAANGNVPITARVVGHRAPRVGDEVSVVIEGEVVCFPRA